MQGVIAVNCISRESMDLKINDLKESNSFLNDLYENVTSAIFIADHEPRIQSFNDAFKTLFYKPEDQILKNLCGNAIGCIFTVEEGKNCGETSNCHECILRECIIKSFTEKVPVYKQRLDRRFVINNVVVEKNFIFTTKYVPYGGDDMILVIVDDITELEVERKKVEAHNKYLREMIRYGIDDLVQMADRLSSETREKEVLMKELQHRVGNTLQIISSLLRLQVHNHEQGMLEDALNEVDTRIQTINLLYRELLNSNSLSDIDLGRYLESLNKHIFNSYLSDGKSVLIHVNPDAALVPIGIAMPLGLVINEAFRCFIRDGKLPDGEFVFSISVSNENHDLHMMKISIRESGEGLAVLKNGFMGMSLIKALAGQIKGVFSFVENNEKIMTIKYPSGHVNNRIKV